MVVEVQVPKRSLLSHFLKKYLKSVGLRDISLDRYLLIKEAAIRFQIPAAKLERYVHGCSKVCGYRYVDTTYIHPDVVLAYTKRFYQRKIRSLRNGPYGEAPH